MKTLFRLIQCIHHFAIAKNQLNDTVSKSFESKLTDLNRYVQLSWLTVSLAQQIELINSISPWANGVPVPPPPPPPPPRYWESQILRRPFWKMAETSGESHFFSGSIANMIPESPLNKMVPLTEDHEGGVVHGDPR